MVYDDAVYVGALSHSLWGAEPKKSGRENDGIWKAPFLTGKHPALTGNKFLGLQTETYSPISYTH